MAPKKDESKVNNPDTIVGFEPRETKLLAAAFVSSIGVDKYDYDLMATLTGNTAGSLKKMFPPVKRKAMEAQSSFATFLGTPTATNGANGDEKKPAAKATPKKRKATSEPEEDAAAKDLQPEGDKMDEKADSKKKAPAKGRGRTKKVKAEDVKKEATPEDDDNDKDAEGEIENEI